MGFAPVFRYRSPVEHRRGSGGQHLDLRAGLKTVWKAVVEFIEDNALTLAAALSFYTALSLSPLMVILVSVGGLLGPGMQDRLVEQITVMIGTEAGEAIRLVLKNASQDIGGSKLSAIIGIATLVFSAATACGSCARHIALNVHEQRFRAVFPPVIDEWLTL